MHSKKINKYLCIHTERERGIETSTKPQKNIKIIITITIGLLDATHHWQR